MICPECGVDHHAAAAIEGVTHVRFMCSRRITSAHHSFMTSIRGLSERKVNKFEAMNFMVDVLGDRAVPLNDQPNQKALQAVHNLFAGAGKGAELAAASGTAWGLVNAITEYVDHERRARSQDYRLDSAWFGQGAQIKGRALDKALQLIT